MITLDQQVERNGTRTDVSLLEGDTPSTPKEFYGFIAPFLPRMIAYESLDLKKIKAGTEDPEKLERVKKVAIRYYRYLNYIARKGQGDK